MSWVINLRKSNATMARSGLIGKVKLYKGRLQIEIHDVKQWLFWLTKKWQHQQFHRAKSGCILVAWLFGICQTLSSPVDSGILWLLSGIGRRKLAAGFDKQATLVFALMG